MQTIVLATANEGKIREYRQLLAELPVRIVGLHDVGLTSPPETGATFAANAVLKARHAAEGSGLVALADDSGLEVDALDGAPGLYSARYAGPGATDQANRRQLIAALANVPADRRTGRFRCALAIAQPRGDGRVPEALVSVVEGSCEGLVIDEPRGIGGFGYDPLFLLPERGVTMAELDPVEKNAISHRGRALVAALPLLRRIVSGRDEGDRGGD